VRRDAQRVERRVDTIINHYTKPLAPAAGQPHVSLEDFERASVRVAERRFGARDTIFAPGDPDGQLYFLLEGTVRLYKMYGEYKEATVALLKGGASSGSSPSRRRRARTPSLRPLPTSGW
jgi:CRP-like cAMP-binding protein